jgi:hypothetical protein
MVNWVSDNPKVATVNAVGKVTAVNPGTANIWTITNDGEKTGSVSVTVTGTLYLDECDSSTGWNSSQSLSLNNVDQKQGNACLEFTGSTLDEFKKVFSPAFNSGTNATNGALRFWYFVSDVTKCGPVRVELGSAGRADVDEYSWALTGLANGWNKIDLKISNATRVGTPNLGAINWFRIYDSKSGSITTRIDAIEMYNTELSAVDDLTFNENEIKVYPNPAKGQIYIELSDINFSKLNFLLSDLSGKILINETVNSGDVAKPQLHVGWLDQGLYLLKISSDKKTLTKKINIVK